MIKNNVRNVIAGLFAMVGLLCLIPQASAKPPSQQGCCSHHQGVCGCAGNREQCCDGSLSGCGC